MNRPPLLVLTSGFGGGLIGPIARYHTGVSRGTRQGLPVQAAKRRGVFL